MIVAILLRCELVLRHGRIATAWCEYEATSQINISLFANSSSSWSEWKSSPPSTDKSAQSTSNSGTVSSDIAADARPDRGQIWLLRWPQA
mmetsp:Transcript_45579/g.98716  ORF Transcript_45579/g.98716 Transcript_45579/m.98716 type:complete len:90 (+) Transcript_45579:147-416(+)